MTYPTAQHVMDKALQAEVERLILLCSEREQATFRKYYPSTDPNHIETAGLVVAYGLITRTLMNNERDQQETV